MNDFWARVMAAYQLALSGDRFGAAMAFIKLLAEAVLSIGDESIRTKATKFSGVDYDAMTEDVLCEKLKKLCCEACPELAGGEDCPPCPPDGEKTETESDIVELKAAPKGPFIDAILPIITALIKKLIGL